MPAIWVAQLLVSDATARKLAARHGLWVADVRDAVVCVSGLPFAWHDHPERGLRAIVQVKIRGKVTYVVLYPAGDPLGGVWHLGSAYGA